MSEPFKHELYNLELGENFLAFAVRTDAGHAWRRPELSEEQKLERLKFRVREKLHRHRFAVMDWLILNGVYIPEPLRNSENHPAPGKQPHEGGPA